MYLDIQLKDYSSHAVASTLLTVSTNLIVTCCITFRLLVARRTVANLMPSADARLYTGVIAILIESAAPLTIFGIIVGILQQIRHAPFLQSPGWIVCRYLFECLFYSFCVSQVTHLVPSSLKLPIGALAAHDYLPSHDWSIFHQVPDYQRGQFD